MAVESDDEEPPGYSPGSEERGSTEPVAVPYTELSPEALRGVIESFVLREGTEYGERDVALEDKVSQITRQLRRGEAQILFDPDSETIDLVVIPPGARRR
jgi:uncharacterized protein YheU (UPF0270 family)